MSGTDPSVTRLLRARHADEEVRYRAALELDALAEQERAVLLALLDDESWRVRSAAVERLAAPADPAAALPALLAALDGAHTAGGRDAAAAALVRIGPPALPAVMERLGSPDVAVRLAALAVLGDVGVRRTAPALTARLADPDPNVRVAAAEALGKVGGPEAAGALLAALDSDDRTLQGAALGALHGLRVAPPGQRVARLLEDRSLKPACYRALGASDDPVAWALLTAGLSERSRSAREAALGALGELRGRAGAEAASRLAAAVRATAGADPGVAASCLAALASEDPLVPPGALAALGWIGDAGHVPAMAQLAEDDRYRPHVEEALEAMPQGQALQAALWRSLPALSSVARLAVLGTLAGAGDASALQALAEATGDADVQVQAEAIACLGRIGDPRAVPALGGLLGDDLPAVSGVAAAALLQVAARSPEGARAVLGAVRARADTGPSAASHRVLGALGERGDLEALRRGLSAPGPAQRVAATGALAALAARLPEPQVVLQDLGRSLTDPAWVVRAAAARALAVLGAAAAPALPRLMAATRDAEPTVRAAAAEGLAACGGAAQVARLEALAGDPGEPPQVVAAALHALGVVAAGAPAVLERGLAHPDAEVAKEAAGAAARLPGEEGRRLLRLAATSPRWDVRAAAARGMGERRDPALRADAALLAALDPDPLVARAFGAAVRALTEAAG